MFPCYYFYYYGGCVGDVTVAQTSTNQGNLDIGLGGEWRVSPYDRGKIFLEARYVKLLSPNSSLPPGGGAGWYRLLSAIAGRLSIRIEKARSSERAFF